MNSSDTNSDTAVHHLTLATVVALLLAGVTILVSANTQIPFIDSLDNPNRLILSSGVSSQYPTGQLSTNSTATAQPVSHPNSGLNSALSLTVSALNAYSDQPMQHALNSHVDPAMLADATAPVNVTTAAQPVRIEKLALVEALAPSAVPTKPAGRIELTNNEAHTSSTDPVLSPEQLKRNALSVLRGMPDYYPSEKEYQVAVAHMNQMIKKQQLEINVNRFLLSQHSTEESQLAQLQMQPFFAKFDRPSFLNNSDVQQEPEAYVGVGFPHVESNNRSATDQYKPYKQLVSFSGEANGNVVPNVKCMGLSAETVAKRAEKYESQILELALEHNVSSSLIKAVIAKESCYDPTAKSPVGAIGLMQLMPATARWLKVKQPENPQQNMAGGVRYLAQLRKRFGRNELALAAYNAGPGNVERYHGIPPFAETQNYVVDVMHFYRGYVATTRYKNALNSF